MAVKRTQSVHKAVAILRAAAAAPGGATASALARAAALPHPTALRIIRTLEDERLLVRLPDGGYAPGLELARLAGHVRRGDVLRAAARPAMEELARATGESVTLSVPDGDRLEIVEQIDSAHVVATRWVGGRFPLHASSGGKVLLASLDDSARERVLAGPLPALASRTLTSAEALRAEVDEVRARGWSEIVDELEDGLASVSVPVTAGAGTLAAILNVSGPTYRLDAPARERAVAALRDAAAAVGRAIDDGMRPVRDSPHSDQ